MVVFGAVFIKIILTNGIPIKGVSGIPVSNNKIFHFFTSESLLATTDPADPEPTIIKSYSSSKKLDKKF